MTLLDTAQIQSFIDAIPTPVFVKNKDGRPVLVNSSACDLHGLSREQIIDSDPEEHFPPERAETFRRTDEQVLSSGQDAEYEEQIVDSSGNPRFLLTRKRLMHDANGEPLVIGVASDTTALRETEQHYRHSVDLNPQIPWTATPDGFIDEIGPRWATVTGTLPEQAKGMGWVDAVHAEDIPAALDTWQQAL